jgi:deoxyuridine 5'-triphosphate nucleotidohydrolase
MVELNEREKTIVDLIGKLADAANDENTTEETIDHIMTSLQEKSKESAKKDMEEAENENVPMPKVGFPESRLDKEIEKMMEQESEKEKCHCHNNQPLIFTRIREVNKPTKAHPTDAGIDFFVPDAKAWNDDFKDTVKKYSRNMEVPNPDGTTFDGLKFDGNVLEVSPNAHVAIPSGIKTIIPQGLAMMMVNKSGVATKLKLDHSACLIDSEYRDELIFCFFNHNVEPVKIEPGMKITQGLIVPVINLQLQECLNCVYDDITKSSGNRGGGFGSSGAK